MKSIFIFLITLTIQPCFGAYMVNKKGWATPCLLTGTSSSLAPSCATWCQNKYGTSQYESTVTSYACSNIDMTDTTYEYCCVNNTLLDIIRNCKCADPNQMTVSNNSGKSYTKTVVSGSGNTQVLEYVCSNLYCFCDASYYGTRQLMSSSTSGTCTKCPCQPDTYSSLSNTALCGTTRSSIITNNANAPSTTLENCKVGPITSVIPETARTYYNSKGTFILDSQCAYSN